MKLHTTQNVNFTPTISSLTLPLYNLYNIYQLLKLFAAITRTNNLQLQELSKAIIKHQKQLVLYFTHMKKNGIFKHQFTFNMPPVIRAQMGLGLLSANYWKLL